MNKFFLTPIGRSLGHKTVQVAELLKRYGPARPGLVERTGFSQVHHLADEVSLAKFAVSAVSETARVFLRAKCDLLIAVSSSSEKITPGVGSEIHELLGLPDSCSVINVNDACTGFSNGLRVASLFLRDDAVKTILLVTVDAYSRFFPLGDLSVSPLFSDGTAAFLVSRSSPRSLLSVFAPTPLSLRASVIETAGSLRELLSIDSKLGSMTAVAPRLNMRGGEVFSFVAGRLPRLVANIKAQMGDEEFERVSWFVHQGSRLVVNHVSSVLGQQEDSLFRAKDYGNVVSSSIPFQLQDNWDELRKSELIGLVSFGVGMSLSVLVLRTGWD